MKTTGNPAESLTRDDVEKLINELADDLHDSSPALARLCLLLEWLTYYADEHDREHATTFAEMRWAPFADDIDEILRGLMRVQLAALKKGGA